jgi:hypothetical protein
MFDFKGTSVHIGDSRENNDYKTEFSQQFKYNKQASIKVKLDRSTGKQNFELGYGKANSNFVSKSLTHAIVSPGAKSVMDNLKNVSKDNKSSHFKLGYTESTRPITAALPSSTAYNRIQT